MIAGEIVAIEIEQASRRTAPCQPIREPMHQNIVEGQHDRCVDRMRLGDRISVTPTSFSTCLLLAHGPCVCTARAKRKGALRGRPLNSEILSSVTNV